MISLNCGRVQIRIPAIHGAKDTQVYYLEDQFLPWAKPAVMNAAGNDMGQFIIPAKGSRVFVTFEVDNSSNPIYFGGVPTKIGNTHKIYNDNPEIYNGEEVEITTDDAIQTKDSRATTTIYKSFKGATIEIDDKDGEESIRIISADGQVIEMGVSDSSKTPLKRRGSKIGSDNPSRYIKLTNGTESIEIIDGEININARTIRMNGIDVTP